MVRKNIIKTVETTRGATSFFIGSVPRARMASICSVTTIDPSSLAMPEEFRPATINPVMIGAKFAHHSDRNQLADQRKRTESFQGVGAVQGQRSRR